MDSAHPHLLVNHFPIIGLLIASLAYTIGFVVRNKAVRMTGMALMILTTLFVFAANRTGEEAEEIVEGIEGSNHRTIHEHEETAELAVTIAVFGLALLGLSLWAEWKEKSFAKFFNIAVLLYGFGMFGLTAYVGLQGGKIRHTEIDNPPAPRQHGDHDAHEEEQQRTEPDQD